MPTCAAKQAEIQWSGKRPNRKGREGREEEKDRTKGKQRKPKQNRKEEGKRNGRKRREDKQEKNRKRKRRTKTRRKKGGRGELPRTTAAHIKTHFKGTPRAGRRGTIRLDASEETQQKERKLQRKWASCNQEANTVCNPRPPNPADAW